MRLRVLSLENMPPDEEKRRKSIAYILRRRKRGRKVGANSGEVVKSWAEASEVNFKPTGAKSNSWRWLVFPAWLSAVTLPWMFFVVARIPFNSHAEDLAHPELHPIGWVLVIVACLLIIAICGFALAYIGLTVWRLVRSL
ncbi:MAG: hypothetical protein HRT81_04700 [Henriciella sp.]|nr:hypothetical protein [Henriciella sp.]